MHPTEKRIENQYIIFDSSLIDDMSGEDFDVASYRASNSVLGEARGRNAAYFVKCGTHRSVLRHYYRGGLMASLSRDKYWWSDVYKTRSWREWYLLVKLKDWDLPVPRALGANVVRRGLFYTADILMEEIENAKSLSSLLSEQKIDEALWRKIGATLRRFHQRGVYHADLNAHNILIDDVNEVYLIDFDKGRIKKTNRSWQLANLNRLRRSLDKIKNEHQKLNFDDLGWENMVAGYTQL